MKKYVHYQELFFSNKYDYIFKVNRILNDRSKIFVNILYDNVTDDKKWHIYESVIECSFDLDKNNKIINEYNTLNKVLLDIPELILL